METRIEKKRKKSWDCFVHMTECCIADAIRADRGTIHQVGDGQLYLLGDGVSMVFHILL